MYRQHSFFDRLRSQIIHDRILTSVLSAYFTINLLLILLAGVAVWPVILSLKGTDSPAAGLCDTVYRTNLPLLAVYLMISGAFMLLERHFKALNIVVINMGIGGIVNLVMLMTQRYVIQGVDGPNFMLTLLWFIISFMFSWILTLLPVLVICGLAKLIHMLFFKFHEWGS